MADNREAAGESQAASISELQDQVLSIVVTKLERTVEKPIDNIVLKVLSKRRKKWRKRHHLVAREATYPSPDTALREEKEQLTDQFYQTGKRLLDCRRSSYATIRQLEKETRAFQLQARETHRQALVQPQSSLTVSTRNFHPAGREVLGDQIIKDLQLALSQADALAKVQQMKLIMTPRFPSVHRRPSTENTTLDQFGMSLLEQHAPGAIPPMLVEAQDETEIDNTNPTLPAKTQSPPSAFTLNEPQHNSQENTRMAAVDQGCSPTNSSVGPKPLAPDTVVEEQGSFYEEVTSPTSENLPRIACIMSLTEGQETASVVELIVENDAVIETQSSICHSGDMSNHLLNSSMEERLDPENALPLVPEKEEIVSTTPDNDAAIEIQSYGCHGREDITTRPLNISLEERLDPESALPLLAEKEEIVSTSPENLIDNSPFSTEEELLKNILKDAELAAWIAKPCLRPRRQINYNVKKTSKRQSRSRNSIVMNSS